MQYLLPKLSVTDACTRFCLPLVGVARFSQASGRATCSESIHWHAWKSGFPSVHCNVPIVAVGHGSTRAPNSPLGLRPPTIRRHEHMASQTVNGRRTNFATRLTRAGYTDRNAAPWVGSTYGQVRIEDRHALSSPISSGARSGRPNPC